MEAKMLFPSFAQRRRPGVLLLLLAAVSGSLLHSGETRAQSDNTTDSESEEIQVATEGVRSSYDISGDWLWSESNIITVPGYVSGFIGIEEEGPTLHLLCEVTGTLDVTQSGNSFTGEATQTGECFSQGGQGPVFPFPPTLHPEGSLGPGRSFFIDFGDCEYNGHLSVDPETGEVIAISATGNCAEVFSPASFKAVGWSAIRP
jgi:hypothetical protein